MNESINPPIQGFCLSSSPAFAYPRAKAETKECLKPPHRLRYNPILELNGAIRESSSNRLLAVAASTASGGGQGDKNGSGGAPEGATARDGRAVPPCIFQRRNPDKGGCSKALLQRRQLRQRSARSGVFLRYVEP